MKNGSLAALVLALSFAGVGQSQIVTRSRHDDEGWVHSSPVSKQPLIDSRPVRVETRYLSSRAPVQQTYPPAFSTTGRLNSNAATLPSRVYPSRLTSTSVSTQPAAPSDAPPLLAPRQQVQREPLPADQRPRLSSPPASDFGSAPIGSGLASPPSYYPGGCDALSPSSPVVGAPLGMPSGGVAVAPPTASYETRLYTAYQPLWRLQSFPPTYRIGRGIIGQPKLYIPGQPVRNFFRYISP